MKQRVLWFLLGAVFASLFWIAIMKGIGQEWLDILLTPG
jgi:hypothetical protein